MHQNWQAARQGHNEVRGEGLLGMAWCDVDFIKVVCDVAPTGLTVV